MDNPRPEKVAVVDEVRQRLEAASGAILTEYRGLKVSELATLRRTLRTAGGEYKIYKNTLVRFAVRDLGLDELEGMLTGPTAIAFVDGDAAAVAKALRDYARTNPALVVKGGLLGRDVLDSARTAALADLPSREVLLSRLAGGLAAPLQQMAGLLQALPRNLAYGLKALIDKGGAPGAPADAPAPAEAATPGAATPEAGAPEAGAPEAAAEPAPGVAGDGQAAGDEAAIEAAEAAAPRVDDVEDASGDRDAGHASAPEAATAGTPEQVDIEAGGPDLPETTE